MSKIIKNDIDYTKFKFERGITPDDINDKCFQLCKDYLGGVWLKLTVDQIVIKRLSGGLTNQLYYCAINEELQKNDVKEPQEVVIRLYEEKHLKTYDNDGNERQIDLIIALMVSENKLGPKIYGLFESGQMQRYYKHKSFRSEEQNDPKIVEGVARVLARLHAMDAPIKKTANWVINFFDNCYRLANERFDLKGLYEECNCEALKANDLSEEIEWLKKTIVETDSPVTFIHLDFRGSNIMVTESDGIVVCDLEYSCYDCRGVDFGTLLDEWNRETDWRQFDKPYEFPDDNTIIPFIESYIDESIKLKGKQFIEDKRNSVEHILTEVKVFTLFSNMFNVLMTLKANKSMITKMPFDKKVNMQWCDQFYGRYLKNKQQIIEAGAFQ